MQDKDIESVLQSVGPREKPPAEVEAAVREGLRLEWRAMVGERQGLRRRRTGLALAAGLAIAAIGGWFALPGTSGEDLGRIAVASESLRVKSGLFSGWAVAEAGHALKAGEALETGPAGHGALSLAGGLSARLDAGTRVTLASATELVLDRGALYIDAGPDPSASTRLDVTTPSGSVSHVGTQYEVRLLGSGVRLRVREGRVEWKSKAGAVAEGRGGEQLTIAGNGSVTREETALSGDSWNWIGAATPGLELEGLRLSEFLDWAARELGSEIRFDRSETVREVESIVLHGSISGLTPQQALAAVLATTRVRAAVSTGLIVVYGSQAAARSVD
jgi:ferric-dicitrate binding protein FerR (iron transport regulator)